MTPKGEHLFPEDNKARYGESRRTRPLFLPNLLLEESRHKGIEGKEQDHAYEIICKWADLESSGKLSEMNETAIEGEFCKEIFGEALGYDFFADSKDSWNFQPKFSVNGGQADAAIGIFGKARKPQVHAVIELKGPRQIREIKFPGAKRSPAFRRNAQKNRDVYALPGKCLNIA